VQEDQWRKMFRHMLASGVLSGQGGEFEVYADSTGMQVKARTGETWIRGHWGESTTEKALGIAAAPTATGESRKDRVILRADFGANLIELDVLTGVAGTTPAVPAVTQSTTMWEIALATVTVGNSVITIAAGDVTADERLLVGEIATSNRPTLRVIRDVDLGLQVNEYTVVPWTEATKDNAGMWDAASPSVVTITRAGLWSITGYARVSPTTGTWFILPELALNNTALGSASGATGGAAAAFIGRTGGHGTPVSVRLEKELKVGDVIRFYLLQTSGVALTSESELAPVGMSLTAYWIGPSA
jgi:hypothetical protein